MGVNIVLIGLMGAGKTTVGKALAKLLKSYKFVDIDAEIEKKENKKIVDIFKEKSEKYFREIETEVIQEVVQKQNQIISIGGGAFEKKENRKLLMSNGIVFYLRAGVNELYERIKGDTLRPLLDCADPRGRLQFLLNQREKNYKKAHFIINTENKTIDKIVTELIKGL